MVNDPAVIMEREEHIRVRELLDQAMQLPGSEREAFLERSCAGNEGLRRRVEELIAALEQADDFLAEGQPSEGSSGAAVGDEIGRYQLMECIGEGGMGVVYRALQQYPIRRTVALKIIKAGMDTRQVVARFQAERQALALMDHPNIARVIDAGATDTGRPYFVMELVAGVPITRFCDQLKLPVSERLELFRSVCSAVHHAHQKGIIHRDIKPSNILVTVQDGRPLAKVIDFGVAKATQGRLGDHTLYTGLRQMIGTPAYMSPEQARAFADGGADVDTRSDVYSLGVVLYELLTGTTPFDATTLQRAAVEQLLRVITEQEAPPPSTRLGGLDEGTRLQTAQARREEPRRLSSIVRGDLDWIVLRCLEKDRGRRYGSASALADDVGRFLHQEPVEACRPTRRYRFWKFIRRHRAGVSMAVASLLVLLVSLVVAAAGFLVCFLLDWDIPDKVTVFDHVMRLELRDDDWRGVLASRGLVCCRQGRYEDALRYTERFISDHDQVVTPIGLCVRAIAQGRLHQKDEAMASLAQVDQLLQSHPIDWVLTEDYAGGFGYRAIAVMLRKEAADLLTPAEN